MSNPLHEWLHLIEVSGPFLATPVLEESFPQGLDGRRSCSLLAPCVGKCCL